jgi:hypothetical protein
MDTTIRTERSHSEVTAELPSGRIGRVSVCVTDYDPKTLKPTGWGVNWSAIGPVSIEDACAYSELLQAAATVAGQRNAATKLEMESN